ncbi:hypothetical protein Hypma_001881 [Hypsizygus marmoreus]|uniref:Uncharacterized protein n=1 Tax=Hypsizygus marmoreus TaxID=39966 RepID=A0A369JCH8_HYPMA|nr:hypothetical protein Hypma_001881 [Hypsizygus marmoreus]
MWLMLLTRLGHDFLEITKYCYYAIRRQARPIALYRPVVGMRGRRSMLAVLGGGGVGVLGIGSVSKLSLPKTQKENRNDIEAVD